MKAYTNTEQSQKLAEILPLESADMSYVLDIDKWEYHVDLGKFSYWVVPKYAETKIPRILPCWSLAALLDQLEDVICDEEDNQWELVIKKEGVQYDLYYLTVYGEQENIELDHFYDDLIDCCYEMILKLKEKDLI